VKTVEKQSASAYFKWDITLTLCNACNPTFYWPVQCNPCSCRVCLMHGPLVWALLATALIESFWVFTDIVKEAW